MAAKTVVLFFSHRLTHLVAREFDRLRRELAGPATEVTLLFDHRGGALPRRVARRPHFLFNRDTLGEHGYRLNSAETNFGGDGTIPPLLYYREHPHRDFYWVIEQDVRFRGRWSGFFDAMADRKEDLLATYVRPWSDDPDWPHWRMSHPGETIPLEERTASFNVIYRLSNRAMAALHAAQSGGWRGHNEVLVPTLLLRAGLQLGDIGGRGPYVPEGQEDRFYPAGTTPGADPSPQKTIRTHPPMLGAGRRPHTLYHPVKEDKIRIARRALKEKLRSLRQRS